MTTFAQFVSKTWDDSFKRPRVSYRRYGLNGEYRRPIIHRFDIKGGDTVMDLMTENITRSNSLLRRLQGR